MTEAELIAAEERAVALVTFGFPAAKCKRLCDKMRAFSQKVRRQPLPNDVSVDDAWLQLVLRARDLADDPAGAVAAVLS